MREPVGSLWSEQPADQLTPKHRNAINEEVSKLLASPAFRNSKRSKDFLAFVVEKTLAGDGDALKERTVGAEVFGKDVAYNPNEDPIVRVKAGDIRKRLGVYYSALDRDPGVVIELAAGSYMPRFHFLNAVIPREVVSTDAAGSIKPGSDFTSLPSHSLDPIAFPTLLDDSLRVRKPTGFRQTWILPAAGLCLLLVALPTLLFWNIHKPKRAIDQFWQPVLESPLPIIVAAAYTPVYLRSDGETLPKNVYTEARTGYLGGGDLVAASQIAGLLGSARHAFVTRIGDSVSFQDLSATPSILIGYSVHFWDPLMKEFRYTIKQQNGMILDRGAPTAWIPHNLTADLHADDDYAIVVRTFHPQTHETMILVEGAEQYGTEAAAELITNPGLLAEALKDAPSGWQQKNLQFVLHTRIVGNAPAVPQVVASYYW